MIYFCQNRSSPQGAGFTSHIRGTLGEIFCQAFIQKGRTLDFTDFESHHKVIDSIEISDRVIYLFDYMDFPRHTQAQNLKCYTKEGKLVWIAEHPTNATNDSYTSISFDKVLKAFSFGCYSVEIDIITGKILRKVFTK